jgi:AraC-like DNA-binding protein
MKTRFNLDALTQSIAYFYRLSGLRVSVFDNAFHEIASYPQKRSPFCEMMRQNAAFDQACRTCDQAHSEEASLRKDAYLYQCHAGLYEIIAPLRDDNGGLIGFLFFSHILNYATSEEAWAAISEKISAYPSDIPAARAAIQGMPLHESSYLEAASFVLQVAAAYLCGRNLAYLQREGLNEEIESYIEAHLAEDLSVAKLAKAFSVSRAALYASFKDKAPSGIAAYVRARRINKAKALMQADPNIRIADLAEQVGFADYSNFIAAFRKYEGITPKQYAKSQKRKEKFS